MGVLGTTGDKVLGTGVASGAASGLSVAGPVGAVVGSFVGAAAGLFAGKSAQNKADAVNAHNEARQGYGIMFGLKYIMPPDNSPPPKPGSLGYALQQVATSTAAGIANGTITGVVVDNSDPNFQTDGQGNDYYMGVKLVPDTSKYVMPDGSLMADQDFDYNTQYNTGKLLNTMGYGITKGPLIDHANKPTLPASIAYVYTSPNGSKLTADAIKALNSMGITISNLSPAALLASGQVNPSNAPLQASFGAFGSINPIMIIGIILLIILFIFFKRE